MPKGPGIISYLMLNKLLLMADIAAVGWKDDFNISARGCTATLGNFAKATFDAIFKTYNYLTSELWKETAFTKSLSGVHCPFCEDQHKSCSAQDPSSSCGHHISLHKKNNVI